MGARAAGDITGQVPEPARPPGWLPKSQFNAIYRQVPRLCVEVVVVAPERGVLLMLRDIPWLVMK